VKYHDGVKRWAFTIILFLLLGAIVNIAVAWGCALWSPYSLNRPQMHSHSGRLTWIVSTADGFGLTCIALAPDNEHFRLVDEGPVAIPRWSRAVNPPTEAEFAGPTCPYLMEYGYGWPARSARALAQWDIFDLQGRRNPQRFRVVSGFEALDDGAAHPLPFRMLPIRPIWPGLAINTVFYAFVLWLAFAAAFAFRRWRRIKRGLCPKCAYDLRNRPSDSSACPECGAVVKPKVVAA